MGIATTRASADVRPSMKNTARVRVEPSALDAAERARVEDFVRANEDSPVSILLRRLVTYTDHGLGAELLADDTELSPNQAAELLKMSRPHLLTFMDRGTLPFHRVGSHRRIKMSDLLTFMEQREAGRALVAEATHKAAQRSDSEPLTDEELHELAKL